MGGIVVLLAGDFQQTIPVIHRGTPADEIHACIKSSHLWSRVEKLSLKTNMRVHLHNDVDSRLYAEMLLKIDNCCLEVYAEGYLSRSREFCNLVENDMDLIAHVFPELQQNLSCDQWLCARAILAPKNEVVSRINTDILKEVQGEMKEYLSMDTIMNTELRTSYPTEFLNSLELSGVPRIPIIPTDLPFQFKRTNTMLCQTTLWKQSSIVYGCLQKEHARLFQLFVGGSTPEKRRKISAQRKRVPIFQWNSLDLCTDQMKNAKKHYHLLKLLLTASPARKRAIIRTADKSQLHLFCLNILEGNLAVDVKKLRKYTVQSH
ncbi:ATP-dependent DNA helicase [Trichonephila clavipes]|uniref:ATP-dependent DNA helicase n=1 Tax=Trichonephila clavipes TaxID=2585209 RepID=A0A8X6SJ03_TRICX|nr:ATP-dependent DNA helicase [Trichonephila clavipes]